MYVAFLTVQVQRQKAFVQRCRDQVEERVKELEAIKAAEEMERKKVCGVGHIDDSDKTCAISKWLMFLKWSATAC